MLHHYCVIIMCASCRLYILRNLRRSGCDARTMKDVYQAVIRPVLLYAFASFCNASKGLLSLLCKAQKRAMKIIYGGNFSLILTVEILTTAETQCLKLFHNIEQDPNHPLRSLFDSRKPSRRNPSLFAGPKTRTARFYNLYQILQMTFHVV